ncbi:MAG TPA: hypothetical protein VLU38_00480 [Methanomassiliicoccales archaeon]|nr:hypothetical protein [Methanomassiliicoccales archaeon]
MSLLAAAQAGGLESLVGFLGFALLVLIVDRVFLRMALDEE